jgi:hypothetical protein
MVGLGGWPSNGPRSTAMFICTPLLENRTTNSSSSPYECECA